MQILEGVFSGSYSKKDGSIPAPSADLQALHCAALSSWSLLLTLLTSGDVFRLATTQVFTIPVSKDMLSVNKLLDLMMCHYLSALNQLF